MFEDLLTALLIAAIGFFGAWNLYRALDKWRVLLSSRWWACIPATVRDADIYNQTLERRASTNDTRYAREADSLFTRKRVRQQFQLRLTAAWSFGGKDYSADNKAHYNHHPVFFHHDNAKDLLTKVKENSTIPIRCNPARPEEYFLGPAHFPLAWAMVQTLFGWFFANALAVTLEWVCGLAGIPEPLLAGRNILIYGIPAAAVFYLTAVLILARVRVVRP
jgi:hypothetical protein